MVNLSLFHKFQRQSPAQLYRMNLDYAIVYVFLAVHQIWQVSDASPSDNDFCCNIFIISSIDNSTARLSKQK